MHTRSSEQMEGDGGACPVDASKETKAMDLDHQDDSEADSADANAVATSPDIAVQGDEKEHEGGEGSNGSKMDGDPVGAETHSADTNAVATSPVIAVQGNGKEQDGDEGSNGNKMDEDHVVADATQPEESAANVNTLSQVNDNEVALSAMQDIEGQGGTPKEGHTPAKGRDSNKSPRNKRGKKASCKYWNHITPIVISFFSS